MTLTRAYHVDPYLDWSQPENSGISAGNHNLAFTMAPFRMWITGLDAKWQEDSEGDIACDTDSHVTDQLTINVHPENKHKPAMRQVMANHLSVIDYLLTSDYRVDSRIALSQWETVLLCNDVSHWLGASLESPQHYPY